ncbi:MAG: glycoside hydrolase family 3 C-terminal domain-containing protein [Clostridiales bacterium]|nr:glycoside hydrolase family 3 C-terminal domain-containing protein [Clostridiales bacterium]
MKKILKTIFGNKGSRAWFITTAVLLAFFTAVTILINGLFYNIISQVLGRKQAVFDTSGAKLYQTEFTDKAAARANGNAVNEAITAEGIVLLKNDSNALPLPSGTRLSVFGKNSANIVTRGSGSAAGSASSRNNIVSLYAALENAGFTLNSALKDFYSGGASGGGRPANPALDAGVSTLATGETPWSSYSPDLKATFSASDAALVVISRIGGESWDLPTTMAANADVSDPGDHYLRLDKNERKLIDEVTAVGFSKVIVLLNLAAPIEADFIKSNSKIDAALWIGAPGDTGTNSLAKILKGEVNPSGRLPDIYAKNFTLDPTFVNFGNNDYTDVADKNGSYTYKYVDYEEGIYTGYRYYETRGFEQGGAWYGDNVTYPFGYGLSYTDFTQEIVNKAALDNSAITKDGKIAVSVKVNNTGEKAGKDAVQLYVTAPYTAGQIEKPHVVLAGFAKSPEIAPGASATVTVELTPYDFSSYDYSDANANGFKGYELDAGAYAVSLRKNSHEVWDSFTATVAAGGIRYETDPVTNAAVKNRYTDAANYLSADEELTVVMSRADFAGTFPAARTADEKRLSADANAAVNNRNHNNPSKFDPDAFPNNDKKSSVQLADLIGLPYGDPLWDSILDGLTVNQMKDLVNSGAFMTADIQHAGVPLTVAADGPAGWADFLGGDSSPIYEVANYACEPIMAATFNTGLMLAWGEAVGDEALVGNARGDGMAYSGWYAPGINLHRSPFGGRVGEYFSEDPFLTGKLAAKVILGAKNKGVYTQVKHFAVNEQETNRTGLCTWLTEQSLRELYLKAFEFAVKEGKTTGMMSSFNRIGARWTGGDYRLLTEILRGEWGFKGMVICDYNTGSSIVPKQMVYAGGDLNLQSVNYTFNPSNSSAADLTVLRNAAHNILYTVANSNAMNYKILGYKLPVWQILLIVFDCVLGAGLAVWGFFAIRRSIKKAKDGGGSSAPPKKTKPANKTA